eukprot:2309246-Rhodomonas_salina.2
MEYLATFLLTAPLLSLMLCTPAHLSRQPPPPPPPANPSSQHWYPATTPSRSLISLLLNSVREPPSHTHQLARAGSFSPHALVLLLTLSSSSSSARSIPSDTRQRPPPLHTPPPQRPLHPPHPSFNTRLPVHVPTHQPCGGRGTAARNSSSATRNRHIGAAGRRETWRASLWT